jgi:hypothetical protein
MNPDWYWPNVGRIASWRKVPYRTVYIVLIILIIFIMFAKKKIMKKWQMKTIKILKQMKRGKTIVVLKYSENTIYEDETNSLE